MSDYTLTANYDKDAVTEDDYLYNLPACENDEQFDGLLSCNCPDLYQSYSEQKKAIQTCAYCAAIGDDDIPF